MDVQTVNRVSFLAGGPAGKLVPDDFLFIGELARETGADPKTIRFYERAELIAPRRHGNFRIYLGPDVARMKNILKLRKIGLPIAQIKDLFSHVDGSSEVLGNAKAVETMQEHLGALKMRQTEINEQIAQTLKVLERIAT